MAVGAWFSELTGFTATGLYLVSVASVLITYNFVYYKK